MTARRVLLVLAFTALGACSSMSGAQRHAAEQAAARAEAAAHRAELAAASANEASQRADDAARALEQKSVE